MLVSASILAVKDNFIEYANSLKFAGADYLHIDLFQNSNDNFKLTDVLSNLSLDKPNEQNRYYVCKK
jgi:hypothetical protein